MKDIDRQQGLDWLQDFRGLHEEAAQMVLEMEGISMYPDIYTPVRD